MPYHLSVLGDANVARFWDAAQLARKDLAGVVFRPVTCLDSLASALMEINDGLDFVLVSVLSTLLVEEGSAVDVSGSSLNIVNDVIKRIGTAAKKSSKVEVRTPLFESFSQV